MFVRSVNALAFLPHAQVPAAFELLCEEQDPEFPELNALFTYFDETWIQGCLVIRWNVSGLGMRTNNHVEGWHNHFYSIAGKVHPNIWHLIEALQKEESATQMTLAQLAAAWSPGGLHRTQVCSAEPPRGNVAGAIQPWGNWHARVLVSLLHSSTTRTADACHPSPFLTIADRSGYLLSLRERRPSSATNGHSATASTPSVGDVVLLMDTLPRGRWKLAVIQDLPISFDGEVRSAVVRTSTDDRLSRPLNKLVPLELGCIRGR